MKISTAIATALLLGLYAHLAAADLEQLDAETFPGDGFGSSVAATSNTVLIGATSASLSPTLQTTPPMVTVQTYYVTNFIIDAVFNQPVLNVDATDLLALGHPATNVLELANNIFRFEFSWLPQENFSVTWSENHGITDRSSNLNPFPGGSSYVKFPPTITNVSPSPGLALHSLSRVEVRFSEPVANVMARDLLVNGLPAQTVQGGPQDYTFSLPPVPPGPARIEWSQEHQIVDARGDGWPLRAILGDGWTYFVDPNIPLPVITELLSTGKPDWIEIHNPANVPLDLTGWYLTDTAGNLTKWRFRPESLGWLAPMGYLIVFARGDGLEFPQDPDFKLSSSGEYLALIMPDGITIASEFSPAFPPLPSGVSYGSVPGTVLYSFFELPTPGAPNGVGTLDLSGILPPTEVETYLRVTEVMFDARRPPAGSSFDKTEFEFIELKNTGPTTLDLTGVRLSAGIDFIFPNALLLGPGQFILVVKNRAAFISRYGASLQIAGEYQKNLASDGETIRLGYLDTFLELEVSQDWYQKDEGFSLVPVNESAEPDRWTDREQWRPSARIHGSPGRDDVELTPIVINEALTFSQRPFLDAIELFNPTTNTVEISHWFLSDDFGQPNKFQFPAVTLIPAGGFLALDAQLFGQNSSPYGEGFSFKAEGEELYLFSADPTGDLTGYVHGFKFGASDTNVTFGRYVTSTGDEHFVAQKEMTFFEPNAGPRVGPVVISEIMYHPPDPLDILGDQDLEYIELRNITENAVALFEPEHPTNTWQLQNAVDFEFPTNTILPPLESLLLVQFNPSTNFLALDRFKRTYGLSDAIPLLGPYNGRLDNAQESVELYKPRIYDTNNTNTAFILIDRVAYTDSSPWPAGADGAGHSLQRLNNTEYGNDPINWASGTPTPGTPYTNGTPPIILEQPGDQVISLEGTAAFSVTASGTGHLRYQWRLNGTTLPGATNPTLVINPVLPSAEGRYDVVVMNDSHSTLSASARLMVVKDLPIIFFHPQSQTVFELQDVTFRVAAAGSIVGYQWAIDNTGIPGATNATLTLTNVSRAQAGSYRAVVFNAFGGVSSRPAELTVLPPIFITQQPENAGIVVGDTATFSVAAVSNSPLTYQWRKNGIILPGADQAVLTIENVQPSDEGLYDVVVTDALRQMTSDRARLTVLFEPIIVAPPFGNSLTVTSYVGGSFTLAVTVTNTATLPISYRWRHDSRTIAHRILSSRTDLLTISDLQLTNSGAYNCVVTNEAFFAPGYLSGSINLTVEPATDSDGDNLPDSYEEANGLNKNDPSDGQPSADSDGDGFSNTEEFIAGTDPRDKQSYLKIEQIEPGSATISFIAQPGKTYAVQYRDNATSGEWQFLEGIIATPPPAQLVQVFDANAPSEGTRYYRLVTPGTGNR